MSALGRLVERRGLATVWLSAASLVVFMAGVAVALLAGPLNCPPEWSVRWVGRLATVEIAIAIATVIVVQARKREQRQV